MDEEVEEMEKMNKFNKYLYVFIFSVITVLVFLLNIEECSIFYLNSNNWVVNFFNEINHSLVKFDIIYVSLWIFILYFYSNVYFDGSKYGIKKIVCIITSFIFTLITVTGKAYNLNNNLDILYSSSGQIFKTIIYVLGYYLIYYAILKKVSSVKLGKLFNGVKCVDDGNLVDDIVIENKKLNHKNENILDLNGKKSSRNVKKIINNNVNDLVLDKKVKGKKNTKKKSQ